MIFKTLDSDNDRWTNLKNAVESVRNYDGDLSFGENLKNTWSLLTADNRDYKRNSLDEIVTKGNIDSYIPVLEPAKAQKKAQDIVNWDKSGKSWEEYFASNTGGNDYINDLIKETSDLSKLTGDDLVEANKKARKEAIAHNEALKQQTLSAKAQSAAFKTLSIAGNMIAFALISKGVSMAIKGIDDLIHKQERLAEAAETAGNNIRDAYSSFTSTQNEVNSITPEFAKLSQGVNQLTGKNENLSTEDYARFLELSSQLAESLPNIGYTLDENGNKIVKVSGTIDEVTQSINGLIESEQQLSHQEIDENMDDVFVKALSDLKSYQAEMDTVNQELSQYTPKDAKQMVQDLLNGESLDLALDNETNLGLFSDLQELFDGVGLKLNSDIGNKISLNHTGDWADLSEEETAQLDAAADSLTEKYTEISSQFSDKANELSNDISKAEGNIKNTLSGLSKNLNSWVTTSTDYDIITETYGSEMGTAIQESIGSIQWQNVKGVTGWNDAKDWIENNILSPLKDVDNDSIRQAYLELFTKTDIPIDSAISYTKQIEDYYEKHNLEIPVAFTDKKKEYSDIQKEFDDRKGSFTSGDVQGLDQFFRDNSIDSADEYEKWLQITQGITDATAAMVAWQKAQTDNTTTPLSFSEIWDSYNDNQRSSLLQLAETGKLTPEFLESNEQYAELLKSVGDNAAIAADKINKMVESSDQLSSMKSGIRAISDVLEQKKENYDNEETREVGIGADTLAGFDAEIQGLDSWKEFEETLGNGKSRMDECQDAANKLATEWVNSNNFLAQLNGTNEDYYIATLKEMGVQNAAAIVTAARKQKEAELNAEKEWAKATTLDLADATSTEIDEIVSENTWTGEACNALYRLALQKQTANGVHLSTKTDIEQLEALVKGAGGATDAIAAWKNYDGSGGTDTAKRLYEAAMAQIEDAKNQASGIEIGVTPTVTNPDNGRKKDKGSKEKIKAAKQTFDWLERKITTINSKLDLLKAKLENAFTVNKKNNLIDKEIKNTNALIKAYEKQAKVYKKQANQSAKSNKTESGEDKVNLNSKKYKNLKKKIRNGQFKGKRKELIKAYDEPVAKAIQEYQDYWDQYQQARTNIQSAKTNRRELKIQKKQNYVDKYDALSSKYDAQIGNATTAKEKNKLEDKKLASTKKSYDYQIKIAKLERGSVKVATLKAEKEAALREIRIEKLQNLSDEQTAQYELNQQLEANANSAKEKNQYETQSRKALEAEYDCQIKIAKENGDVVEQQRLRAELEEKIQESYMKQIENIREEYNLIIGLNNARKSTLDAQISALQANGYAIGTDLYQMQIDLDKDSYQKSIEEIARIEAELSNLTGDALEQEKINLESEKQAAWGYQQSMAEAQQAINDINLAKFERLKTMLVYISDELDYIQKVLSHSDFTFSDKGVGGLTIEGLSNMAVSFAQMSNNVNQIANLYAQADELQRQLDSGEYVGNYDDITTKIHDLIKEAHDLESANYDLGESIKDLVIDSLNSLSDALDESISKYKDALQAQKDLYDYRRKVADQLKSIASLEKQLAALQGSDTEEARARIQRLQVSLADEQQNLKDMEYDKYIQDQEDMLDKVSNDFQDFIAAVADMSVSDICQGMSTAIQDNLDDIETSIQNSLDESEKLGNIATGITGLSDVLSNLDYTGKESTSVDENGNSHYQYTDNNGNVHEIISDSNGTIIGAKINGKDVDIKSKDVLNTESDIDNGSSNSSSSSGQSKQNTDVTKTTTQGNGKLEVGDTVSIKKGAGYTSPQEDGYAFGGNTKNQYNDGKILEINSSKNGALVQHSAFKRYHHHAAWIKKEDLTGFSKGGVASELNKVALANGDDGWATLKRGESVLTPEQTEQFRQLIANLEPLNTVADSIKLNTNIPTLGKTDYNNTTTVGNIDIHLDGSNVVDPDSFIKTLHNPRVLKEVSNGVSSQIGTKMSNRLVKF